MVNILGFVGHVVFFIELLNSALVAGEQPLHSMKVNANVPVKLYLWTLPFECRILFACRGIFGRFFLPFKIQDPCVAGWWVS